MLSRASKWGIAPAVATAIVVIIGLGNWTRGDAAGFSRPAKPSLTFVLHPIGHGGSGEIRVYDSAPNGTEIDVSVLPWLDDGEVLLVRGACAEPSPETVGHLKLEPIPTGITPDGKDIALPTPLQETWDFYSTLTAGSFVDKGFAVVARDSRRQTLWCGELVRSNEGDPLPADY